MRTESTITCPKCGHQATEQMPTDACQFFYDCKACGERLKPLSGDWLRILFLRVGAVPADSGGALLCLIAGRPGSMKRCHYRGLASWSLIRSSGGVLVDTAPDPELAAQVKQRLEIEGDRVGDLHLWRLGPGHLGLIVSIVSDRPQPPTAYRDRLDGVPDLSHVTVEVHACNEHGPFHTEA